MIWLSLVAFVVVWAVFFRWATKVKSMSKVVGHGGGFLVAALVFGVYVSALTGTPLVSPEKPAQAPAPEEQRKERLRKLFRQWDGSLPALVKAVRDSMHNPDSYEHAETVFWDMGDHLVVRMTYRGTNVFGGVVKNWVKAKVSLDGAVIEIMEQGS